MRYLLFTLLINFNLYSQNVFPIFKIKDGILDSIQVSNFYFEEGMEDTLFFDNQFVFNRKIGIYNDEHPNYTQGIFYNLEDSKFGKLDSVILKSTSMEEFLNLQGTYSSISTGNKGSDTIISGNSLYVEINPFPNIYVYYSDSLISNERNPFPIGVSHYTFDKNKNLTSACIYNNKFGSVKYYWDSRGRKIKEGAFFKAKKNGPWKYYNKRGKIVGEEIYENGILITKSGKIPK
jgi:hypothetical protein